MIGEWIDCSHLHEPIGRHAQASLGRMSFHHAQRLTCIRSADTARNNAEFCVWSAFGQIERAQDIVGCVVARYLLEPLVDFAMALVGAAREDDPFRGIGFETRVGHFACVRLVFDLEERRSMVDARGRANDDGRVMAL